MFFTAISNDSGRYSGIFNQDGILTITLSESDPIMPGDVIILSGTVTIDYSGTLLIYGRLYHIGGDFNNTGELRFLRPNLSTLLLLHN